MKPLTKIAPGRPGIARQLDPQKERAKAEFDLMAFGTSFVEQKADGSVRHIPLADVLIKATSAAVIKSRAKKPEKYRAYQREYMRKWRAEKP